MSKKDILLILILLLVVAIAVGGSWVYYSQHANPRLDRPMLRTDTTSTDFSEQPSSSIPSMIEETTEKNAQQEQQQPLPTPPPITTTTAPPRADDAYVLAGTVIDVYPSGTITLLTTENKEEVILGGTRAVGLRSGMGITVEVESIYGELYAAKSIKALDADVTFPQDLSSVQARKQLAPTLPSSGFKTSIPPKPFVVIFVDPDGYALSPHFTSIFAAFSVNYSNNPSQAEQDITIPFMSSGLWALKVIPLPNADRTVTLEISYILSPKKTLAELEDKLFYFHVN